VEEVNQGTQHWQNLINTLPYKIRPQYVGPT